MKLLLASLRVLVLSAAAASACAAPGAKAVASPEAPARTNASNFKDMVLAICTARIYEAQPAAAADAGSSARALVDWTLYDAEKSTDDIDRLVKRYTSRDYRNPLAEAEQKGIQFGLLKCLDLYHSRELNSLAARVVLEPNRTLQQARPPGK